MKVKNEFITIKTTKKAFEMLKTLAFLHNQKHYEVIESALQQQLDLYEDEHIGSENRLYKEIFGDKDSASVPSRSIMDLLLSVTKVSGMNEKQTKDYLVKCTEILIKEKLMIE